MDRELAISPWPEWEIVEKIGEGSFGRVYKAERTVHGHTFYSAIKIISIPYSREELESVLSETTDANSARQYFENIMEDCIQEISTMECFRGNSHIVSVEDFKVTEYLDEIGWDIYIRMEYLTDFLHYCLGKTLKESEVLRLGRDLAKALDYCDSLNIIHRDVKPENIFVTRFGDFKLGDFGIARKLEETLGSFSKKGTYAYMAPEVYRGDAYTKQADIYSLGIVLYKLMNQNRLPFLNLEKQLITYHDKENALSRRMSGETLPAPAGAGKEFSQVILKACAFDPEERYQTAKEFLTDLTSLETQREKSKCGTSRKEKRGALSSKKKERSQKNDTPDDGNRRLRESAMWIIAIIVVAAIAVAASAVFMRAMLRDAVNAQAKVMVASMNNSSMETSEEESGVDFATSIQLISDRVKEIFDELPKDRIEGQEGSVIRYYNDENEIRKVLVYPAVSGEGMYEEYYYWQGVLTLAYIWAEDGEENLYYYRDGILIRWVESDGTTHDLETDNQEYIDRGDRYWTNSIDELSVEP